MATLPPAPVERPHPWRDRLRRLGERALNRRAAREAAALNDASRFAVTWPWARREGHGHQTLRAFVQINVLPRP